MPSDRDERNRAIRARYDARRLLDPDASDASLYHEIGVSYGLSGERIRQIVRQEPEPEETA